MTSWNLVLVTALWIIGESTTRGFHQAQCPESFNWARNNQGQDPCLVAAILQTGCRNEDSSIQPIGPLSPNEVYTGPDVENSHDSCGCSSVVYSLLSVCAACQDRFSIDWHSWTKNCATSYLGRLPAAIPPELHIPQWAFNNLSSCHSFDINAARLAWNNGTGMVSANTTMGLKSLSGVGTTHVSPTVNSVFTTSQTIPGSPSQKMRITSPTDLGDTSSDKDRQHANAIVGGVVGSLAALTLIVVVVSFILCRRRRNKNVKEDTPVYARLLEVKIPEDNTLHVRRIPDTFLKFSPLEVDVTQKRLSGNANASQISLPSPFLQVPPETEPPSPAVESSDIFTNLGGHTESLKPSRSATLPSISAHSASMHNKGLAVRHSQQGNRLLRNGSQFFETIESPN